VYKFTPPVGYAQPARWKMLVVTLLAIYPLVMAVRFNLVPLTEGWPAPLRTLANSALLMCVMTYGTIPLMPQLFARWQYGSPGR
jgi:uncharacterized protein